MTCSHRRAGLGLQSCVCSLWPAFVQALVEQAAASALADAMHDSMLHTTLVHDKAHAWPVQHMEASRTLSSVQVKAGVPVGAQPEQHRVCWPLLQVVWVG